MKDRKEYGKAWREAHKESEKAKGKAWYAANRESVISKRKALYAANRESVISKRKEYYQAHKEQRKAWNEAHKEQCKAYTKSDLNALGQTKASIRQKSLRYLNKYGTKIPGYQIHHCCTYTEPYKFIYCSKEMHHLIHSYLRQHNIDADSDHYKYIKHLLDETVVKYNIID